MYAFSYDTRAMSHKTIKHAEEPASTEVNHQHTIHPPTIHKHYEIKLMYQI
jgi:hypothetical protein